MDCRRETFWNEAIRCKNLNLEAIRILQKDSVELPMIDPTLNELLQSINTTTRIKRTNKKDQNNAKDTMDKITIDDGGNYFVKHGLTNAMIYAGDVLNNRIFLWKKKTEKGKMSDNEKNLVEAWVVDECTRITLHNLDIPLP